MIPDITQNYTYPVTSWFIHYFTSPSTVNALLLGLIFFAILLTVGLQRRLSALLLWFGWIILYNLNNLTHDPSLPFIGLLLLVFATVRSGEPFSWRKHFLTSDESFAVPSITYWGIWIIFCASFTISGVEKIISSNIWESGYALTAFYNGPIAFSNNFVDWLLTWPDWIHRGMTWLILYSQVLALGMLWHRSTRFIFWSITTLSFAFSLLLLNLTEVLLGMLIFYFFLIESRWLQPKAPLTIWIDGDCPICLYFSKFLTSEDLNKKITIATFKDNSAKTILSEQEITEMNEMVASDGTRVYRGDAAIIRSVGALGGIWFAINILYALPKSIRVLLYKKIAKNRYCLSLCAVKE